MPKEKPTSYLVAFTNPLPGCEEAFNDWYDNVHLKEVTAVEGFISGRRFKVSESQLGGVKHKHKYAVIYEVEAGEAETIIRNLMAAGPMFSKDPVVDRLDSPAFLIESIGDTWHKRAG